ncbi:UPF0489 family protein [Aliarcobacter butzleri]|uniref:UPF0489 family protein n=1 Tax=Aliarcobacter butzleri TaxID=28197 RepID=UPI003B21265D
MCIENITINKKRISIFENHNEAIIPWCEIKSENKPALLTFDYHTDTHLALLQHNCCRLNTYDDYQLILKETNEMLSKPFNIDEMVKILRNDEHIDFAIRTNIISHAYVCSFMTSMNAIESEEMKLWKKENMIPFKIFTNTQAPKPIEHTFKMPNNRIIELDKEHFYNLDIYQEKEQADLAIDDINLRHRISKIQEINKSIFGKKYNFLDNFILDIDLDYFNTLNSINPRNIELFYFLIKKAKLITIARESYFVNQCKLENEKINVELILNRILEHITIALEAN